MSLKFFNTLTRTKDEFKTIDENEVKMYTCGPTVWNYAHIGNFRTFTFYDLVVRYLKYKGYSVHHIMNITDVDDKTIKGAQKQGISLKEYTDKYTKAFFEDLKTLNITPAEKYPRATDSIDAIVFIIRELMDKGLAYESSGSIYYNVKNFDNYGKLAKLDLSKLKAGASGRVNADEYERDDISDFVLWKGFTEDDGEVYWDTTIGKGRPGWHIECSAMCMHYLGETIDIHCGGIDLIFPHHTNEIAQSEGATGKKFVNYWLHAEFLNMKSDDDDTSLKMSKKLGNIVYLRDLIGLGYSAEAIRWAFLSAHYRQSMDFNFKILDQAERTIESINDFISRLKQIPESKEASFNVDDLIEKSKNKFNDALDDDLHTPQAIASVFELEKAINANFDKIDKKSAEKIIDFLKFFNNIFVVFKFEDDILEKEIEDLIKQRQEARKNKDFIESDRIRDRLLKQNIILEDTKDGVIWKRKASKDNC